MKPFLTVSPVRVLALVTLAMLASARCVLAAWPHDPNNGNLALCTAANYQSNPTIESDGAGGAFVTWNDPRSGNYDIYVQRVNAAGVPQWTANGVALCTAAGDQRFPTIVSDGAGGALVTWQDLRSGGNDIYVQRVNGAGVPQWAANDVVLCTAANDQDNPTITSDGAGGAIVTWYDYRGSPTISDIYVQRVNAAGAPQWTANGVALCTAAYEQSTPTITSDGAGGAIVTWFDARSGTNLDIYAQRVNAAGAPLWAANGVVLCTAANNQYFPTIASDGAGGAIVTWYDGRNGTSNYDIFAQRVNAAGVPQWTADGVALCTAGYNQIACTITSDCAGGALVTWQDQRSLTYVDIYAQRVSAAGVPQWTADGVALCTAADNQYSPSIAPDGSGGAIVVWVDNRSGNFDIYAQRVNATGSTLWASNGMALCTAVNSQAGITIVSDGSGGAIVAWADGRGGDSDIYAQRIERYGYLGNPEPSIISVKDTPNDQGGFVKVGWNASYLDVDPIAGVYEYRVWRSAPPNFAAAQAVLARGVTEDSDEAAELGRFLAVPESATSYLWELVGTQQAFELPGYSMVTATTSDSVGAGNPRTAFMVEAGSSTYTTTPHWFSAPDSGYSVDNLPPVIPAPFTGAYSAGATHLHWGLNHESDLAGYRLYRGSSSGFVPAPGNLISAQPDTGFGDVGAAGSWYKLSAIDAHGNESLYAILGPNGTLDAPGGGTVAALYFAPPSPSPTSGSTTFRLGLPREGTVNLTLFDQQGRRVRDLLRGVIPAGEHRYLWDGRDDQGHPVPSGLYFARLEATGRILRARLAVVR